MAAAGLLVTAGTAIAVGATMRVFSLHELVTGIALPVADPALTAAFVGDFLIAVGAVLLALWAADTTVGVPEIVVQAVGVAIFVAVLAMPKLAGWYVQWRMHQTENV